MLDCKEFTHLYAQKKLTQRGKQEKALKKLLIAFLWFLGKISIKEILKISKKLWNI